MILLTGASGFIGKNLLSALIRSYGKDQILAFTSAPIEDCQYLLHNNYVFERDIFQQNGFASRIDTIIHAGAFIPKKGADANNIAKCNSNIFNTEKMLDANLPALRKIIYLSTVDVYGPAELISEDTLTAPVSLYGESKLYGEKLVNIWAANTRNSVQILRVGHVYGPGEEAYQKIIPVTINNLLNDQPVEIWGAGNEIRSFIYIDDIVTAVLNAVKSDESAGIINLAGSGRISIKELVYKLIAISGKNIVPEIRESAVKGRDLVFDNKKMKDILLPAEIQLEEGLTREWEYMKSLKA